MIYFIYKHCFYQVNHYCFAEQQCNNKIYTKLVQAIIIINTYKNDLKIQTISNHIKQQITVIQLNWITHVPLHTNYCSLCSSVVPLVQASGIITMNHRYYCVLNRLESICLDDCCFIWFFVGKCTGKMCHAVKVVWINGKANRIISFIKCLWSQMFTKSTIRSDVIFHQVHK